MARRAVINGGRRDEIIQTAMKLFFEHGYEAASVRMIMDEVGGEIGMFYHYFKSKDTLFDAVAQYFFRQFHDQFAAVLESCASADELLDAFLPLYEQSMEQFGRLRSNMHWTIQYALHGRTVAEMVPEVAAFLRRVKPETGDMADLKAAQLVYGFSGTIHSAAFAGMDEAGKKACLSDFIKAVLSEQQE